MEELWVKIKLFLVKFYHFKNRSRIKRYSVPIVLIALVFLTKSLFYPFLGQNSAFLMVSFIVAVSASYGGLGPGFFATFLSAILIYTVFLPKDASVHPFVGDFAVTLIFIFEGIIISIVSEARFQLENQKDEFIGFVAHELRNPLTAVKGFSGLISNSAKANGYQKILSYGEQINAQSDKMMELINDLLDITRIEIGKFNYNESFFPIDALIKEVISHQQIISKNRTLEHKTHIKKIIYGDRYRIGQVITNLISNALKYSPETKKVVVKLEANKKAILVSIRDYGLGIAKYDQKKIFSRFYRTDAVQRNKSEGLGLGLYICNQIVRHYNGKLWVFSKVGEGSTFYLQLPLGNRLNRDN